MNRLLMLLTMLSLGLATSAAYAQTEKATEAPGWCAAAQSHLTRKGQVIACNETKSMRCIKMNNYWCLAQNQSNPWQGTPKSNGQNGLSDGHHAVFSDPKWAARAIAIDLRSKHKAGFRSALQIADRYSPACDTLGTVAVRNKVGRSCKGAPLPPTSFSGPRCPTSPTTTSQCNAQCNCPPTIAETLVIGTARTVSQPLELFDPDGKPTPRLNIVIRNLAKQEVGSTVSETLIAEGIALAFPPG